MTLRFETKEELEAYKSGRKIGIDMLSNVLAKAHTVPADQEGLRALRHYIKDILLDSDLEN